MSERQKATTGKVPAWLDTLAVIIAIAIFILSVVAGGCIAPSGEMKDEDSSSGDGDKGDKKVETKTGTVDVGNDETHERTTAEQKGPGIINLQDASHGIGDWKLVLLMIAILILHAHGQYLSHRREMTRLKRPI